MDGLESGVMVVFLGLLTSFLGEVRLEGGLDEPVEELIFFC